MTSLKPSINVCTREYIQIFVLDIGYIWLTNPSWIIPGSGVWQAWVDEPRVGCSWEQSSTGKYRGCTTTSCIIFIIIITIITTLIIFIALYILCLCRYYISVFELISSYFFDLSILLVGVRVYPFFFSLHVFVIFMYIRTIGRDGSGYCLGHFLIIGGMPIVCIYILYFMLYSITL